MGAIRDLRGQPFDLLVVETLAGTSNGRAEWNCVCECGERVVRGTDVLRQNERRGRKNGCDTCVPHQPLHPTEEQKREAKRIRNAKYRAKMVGQKLPPEPRQKVKPAPKLKVVRVYFIGSAPVAEVKNDGHAKWLRGAFPGGEVREVAA